MKHRREKRPGHRFIVLFIAALLGLGCSTLAWGKRNAGAGDVRPSLTCGPGGAHTDHYAFPDQSWTCDVYVTDASNREVAAEVQFVLIERGKIIEQLPSRKYKPYFWTTSLKWLPHDAGRTFVIRAYVSALGETRVLQSWVKVGPVTRIVEAKGSASGVQASATAKRLLRRPVQIFLSVQATPETQAVTAQWKITCTTGSSAVSRDGSARSDPNVVQGLLVQQIRVPMLKPKFCFVIATGALEDQGRVEVELLARIRAGTS